ncbi:MAG TPA: TatD family hydrolase [Gammaproteobacteria bacterium]|nr:TatD family hydrolase [Gammaproteobacteria bacterium]
MLVDSHCHLDQLEEGVEKALQLAKKEGVQHFLCVSITLQDFPHMMEVIAPFSEVSASVGLHPNEKVGKEPTVDELVRLAETKKIIAIGETGLDTFRSTGDLLWQKERFRQHIRAAKETGKPLIVHSRQAKDDTLNILREEDAGTVGGVLHCFTEDWEMAQAAMDLNFYISFSGIVTFNNAKTIQAVAKDMPLDRMLIETDSPYLAPVPFRGKPNQPAYVRYVAEAIANLRGIDFETVAKVTTANFFRLFKLNVSEGF